MPGRLSAQALAAALAVFLLVLTHAVAAAVDFRRLPSEGGQLMAQELRAARRPLAGLEVRDVQSTPAAAPGTYGVDVRINNPALDRADMTTQSEPTLAVHGATICAGYNNTRAGGIPNPLAGFARSTDGGATWVDQGHTGRVRFSDPVLAIHEATGTFYYASLALIDFVSAIGVATSTDDCESFPTIANASPSANPNDLEDKPWIAVDNSGGTHDGNIYACWARFVGELAGGSTSDEIHFSRSTDGGAHFGDEQVLSPGSDFFPFGCTVAVGPSGEVYVAWSDRGVDFPLRFRRSLDGGVSWDAPVQINTLPIRHPGIDRMVTCEPGVMRPTLNGDIRMLVEANIAVDTTGGPLNGTIYAAWGSDPPGAVDNGDIFMSRSTDGGMTWRPEIQIGAGTFTDQFFPTVAVGGKGVLSIAWYDRRNDPGSNFAIDLYTSVSRDGGATVSQPMRISDVSFPVPPINGQPTSSGNFDAGRSACYMGDYIALTADAQNFWYAWGDNRNTVVSANYPLGRPDPDVYVDRRLINCGDGVLDANEQCDDGNLIDGDGCDSNCTVTGCGNGVVTAGEQCDDGNQNEGDGCDTSCRIASTYTPTVTATPTPSATASETPTPSCTPTPSDTPTSVPTATPPCPGDCGGDHDVTVDEVLIAVNIALGNSDVSACRNADLNGDGEVTVDEILRAVNAALNGCP